MERKSSSGKSAQRIAVVAAISVWSLAVNLPGISRVWAPLGWFGYTTDANGRVAHVSADSPAQRAGLRIGDRFAIAQTPAALRRFAIGPLVLAPRAGFRVTLARISAPPVSMQAETERLALSDKISLVIRTLGTLVFVAVGAFLVLARPRPMTWGFFFYTIGLNPGSDAAFDATIPAVLYPLNWTLTVLSIAAGYAGFLTFALRFPHEATGGWRRPLSRLAPWLFVILGATGAWSIIGPYYFAVPSEFVSRSFIAAGTIVFAAGLLALAATYVHTTGEDRQRIKWVILGFVIGLPAFVAALFLDVTSLWPSAPYWLIGLLDSFNLLVPIAIAYAVIHHHVIDVTFVISRAVVYAVLTALLVAAFALADWLLGRQLSNSGATVAVEVAISIAFAFWLNSMHRRVDRLVDGALFRSRHLAERRLARVAHAMPHVQSPAALSKLLIDEPVDALELASAALFCKSDADRYVLAAQSGWGAGCASVLEGDDKLVLQLQAEQAPLSVHEVRWERNDIPAGIARPQLALPVLLRRRVHAIALYSGHLRGHALDPDEERLIGELGTAAAAAYDHLDAEKLRQEAAELRTAAATLERRVRELEAELRDAVHTHPQRLAGS